MKSQKTLSSFCLCRSHVAVVVSVVTFFAGRLIFAQQRPDGEADSATQKVAPAPAATQRWPLPDGEGLKSAVSQVRDVFADEYAAANASAGKIALAQKLLMQSESTPRPAERWGLLSEAMRLASDAGDVTTSLAAIDFAAFSFVIDADSLRIDALTKLAAKAHPKDFDQLVRVGVRLTRKLLDSGDPAMAQRCVSVASGLARKSKNSAFIAEVNGLQQEIRESQKLSKERAVVESRLVSDGGSPDACLDAGKFFCFQADDWDKGLPLLEKGSDAKLSLLAQSDLAVTRTTESVLSAADAWWTWSEEQPAIQKASARVHAAELYESLLDKTAGLERARIEKRIREANGQANPKSRREKRASVADLQEESTTVNGFSKDGTFKGEPFICCNQKWPKALQATTHAAGASIFYVLPKGAKRLVGKAAVFTPGQLETMGVPPQPGAPLEFEIFLDGRSVWKSPPLAKRDDTADFTVELYGATRLEFRTVCKSSTSAWSAWLNPEIVY